MSYPSKNDADFVVEEAKNKVIVFPDGGKILKSDER